MEATVVQLAQTRQERAQQIAAAGGIGVLGRRIDTTVSEALVLGLWLQGVRTFFCVFGHGSTEIGEVLRIYQDAGLVRVCGVRSEIEASHAAAALRWVRGEKAAVVTSIGPGALQALAASIVPRSDGLGIWYLLGDETTQDEGPNMQQIPGTEQNAFLRLFGTMSRAYSLHTPLALATALRRGLNAVDHPHQAEPFFLLLPLNVQPAELAQFNLDELPVGAPPALGAAADEGRYAEAAAAIAAAERVVVKVGGGARGAGPELAELLELADAVAVTSPLVSGVLPYDHPRNMTVGGSKGSICGNYAMEEADFLIGVGSRFVCQSDSSRTGYPRVQGVVNINADPETATHYGKTMAFVGDAAGTLRELNRALSASRVQNGSPSAWLQACSDKKREWAEFKAVRYRKSVLYDEMWDAEVMTQPTAIKVATDWARARDAVCFFDAGDVQANGFQVVEDDRLGRTFTETGASYMGFAVSALLATAVAAEPFYGLAISGDGSFTMNPQVLIDGVEHGATGCILLLDNRRMGAISGLQLAQYGADCGTWDRVAVDYVAWASAVEGVVALSGGYSPESLERALEQARAHSGLSLIHVPVYFGSDERGSLGGLWPLECGWWQLVRRYRGAAPRDWTLTAGGNRMKIAMLHGPRDLRIEDLTLDTENLEDDQIWVETEITGFKIGTDRGNYEGAEQVPGAPDFPRWVGDSNLGVVRGVGSKVTKFAVGDRVVSRHPHQSAYVARDSESIVHVPDGVAGRRRGVCPFVRLEHALLHQGVFRARRDCGRGGVGRIGTGGRGARPAFWRAGCRAGQQRGALGHGAPDGRARGPVVGRPRVGGQAGRIHPRAGDRLGDPDGQPLAGVSHGDGSSPNQRTGVRRQLARAGRRTAKF